MDGQQTEYLTHILDHFTPVTSHTHYFPSSHTSCTRSTLAVVYRKDS